MTRRGKDINVDEEGLWDLVAADITPLKGRKKAPAPAPKAAPKENTRTGTVKTEIVARAKPAVADTHAKGRDLDRRTEQKLTRGQMEIEATIDLHGHGQAAARETLLRFLEVAYTRDYRCVLVITGKGKSGSGILRTRLQEWVDEPPLNGIVLRATQARSQHGGNGAFYVLLRRRR